MSFRDTLFKINHVTNSTVGFKYLRFISLNKTCLDKFEIKMRNVKQLGAYRASKLRIELPVTKFAPLDTPSEIS